MNRMHKTISAAMACSLLALGACETLDDTLGGRENTSMAVGAIVGAALGSQLAGDRNSLLGAALGAAIGAYAGRELGKQMDPGYASLHDEAASRAMWDNATGQPARWSHTASNSYGEITPLSGTYRDSNGATCRRFRDMVVDRGSTPRTIEGVACLSNNQWVVSR